MKRELRDRNYDVAVFQRRRPKEMLQHWSLSTTSAEKAKWFAQDLISEMNLEEIFNEFLTPEEAAPRIEAVSNKYNITADEPVGQEIAEREFVYDAFLDRYSV